MATYPLAVYFLISEGRIRLIGLALLALVIIRLLTPGMRHANSLAVLALGAAFAVGIAVTNSEVLARLYPVGLNAAMLFAFGVTLIRPPSIIERIARTAGVYLDAAGIRYTRRLTIAWCVFFICNGGIALATALIASREVWAIYNGFLSYVLGGTLFFGERIVRPLFHRRWAGITRP